jgi:prevent-host-death family protein
MKRTASVVQLKARLSEYLRAVKGGGELLVTERGVPIARLVPLDDAQRKSTRRLRLARAGLLKPGRGRLPKALQAPPSGPAVGAGVLEALLAERGDGGDR